MRRASRRGRGDADRSAAQPGQPAELLERRPDLLAREAQLDAANCAPAAGHGGVVPAAVSRRAVRPPERRAERRRPRRGALHQRRRRCWRCRSSTRDARGDQRHRRERPDAKRVLRYEDAIVRALEDVENALVALARRTAARRSRCRAPPPRPTRRSAARNRSTTAGRSICCRCSMRSARA